MSKLTQRLFRLRDKLGIYKAQREEVGHLAQEVLLLEQEHAALKRALRQLVLSSGGRVPYGAHLNAMWNAEKILGECNDN